MKKAKLPAQCVAVSFATATIFDIPVIFNLMQEGSVAGAFASVFVERTGSVKLFGTIFKSVVAQNFQSPGADWRCEWLIVVGPSGDEVGFLKRLVGTGSSPSQHLELFAIRPEYRNQGIGTAVLQDITAKLPQGAQLTVHCTKYAKTMQHILKTQRFKRNIRFRPPYLEEYALTKDNSQGACTG